jgi:hypothetical protein
VRYIIIDVESLIYFKNVSDDIAKPCADPDPEPDPDPDPEPDPEPEPIPDNTEGLRFNRLVISFIKLEALVVVGQAADVVTEGVVNAGAGRFVIPPLVLNRINRVESVV